MKYKGTWGTMSTVAADEGFWGLWRGNLANVLRVVPVYALKFAFNDKFKAIASGGSTAPLTFSQLMMSGTLAVSTWCNAVSSTSPAKICPAGPFPIPHDLSNGSRAHALIGRRRSWAEI